MKVLESVTINLILIILPNLIYIIYLANKKNLKEKENEIVLDFNYLLSIFLIILYSNYFINSNIFIYLLMVLLLAYKKNRLFVSILISVIILNFYGNYLGTILLIILFVIYIIFKNKKKILNICLCFLIPIIIYIFTKEIKSILIFISCFYLLNLSINKSLHILELQSIIKEFENNKLYRESLFKITHEIKNPLAVIKGYLSMIDLNNIDKAKKYLGVIKDETTRSINLLEDFKELSKIKIEPELINYSLLLSDIKLLVIPLLENKKITYQFKTEENIMINADHNRLKQVIVNIIKNSIEASHEFDKINVISFVDNKKLNIIISDTGIGMSKEELNNISIPFYTTKTNGTGLGVCLSKEIIEAHKGKISYTSSLGKGTTVKIVLPIN